MQLIRADISTWGVAPSITWNFFFHFFWNSKVLYLKKILTKHETVQRNKFWVRHLWGASTFQVPISALQLMSTMSRVHLFMLKRKHTKAKWKLSLDRINRLAQYLCCFLASSNWLEFPDSCKNVYYTRWFFQYRLQDFLSNETAILRNYSPFWIATVML